MTEWAHGRTGIDIQSWRRSAVFFIDPRDRRGDRETCRIGSHVKLDHGVRWRAQFPEGRRRQITRMAGNVIRLGLGDDLSHATILGGESMIGSRTTNWDDVSDGERFA